MASEGGEGNGRRQGVIGLVGANGVVRHEGMARRSILLGKADPAAAVSCTRMCGPSRRDMASTLRVTFICGNGFCMLFARSNFTAIHHILKVKSSQVTRVRVRRRRHGLRGLRWRRAGRVHGGARCRVRRTVEPTMRTRIEVMFGYVSASGTSFGERISRWRRPRC